MRIAERISQLIYQIEIAAADRHRERARRAFDDLWNDMEELYFSGPRADDSTLIGWLIDDERVVNILADAGIRTAGQFRRRSRSWYLSLPNMADVMLERALTALARHGIGPSKV